VDFTDWESTLPALGFRISPEADPRALSDRGIDPLEGAVDSPLSEVMVDGLPGREVVGEQAPSAAALEDIEDGVEDLAQGMKPGAAGGLRDRQMGLDDPHFSSERLLSGMLFS
jgi:hypothetical protein